MIRHADHPIEGLLTGALWALPVGGELLHRGVSGNFAVDAWARLGEGYPSDPRPKQQITRIEKRNRMWDNMLRVQEGELEKTGDPQKRVEILKRLTQIYRDRQPDPARAIEERQSLDCSGHYSRPDILRLDVRRDPDD